MVLTKFQKVSYNARNVFIKKMLFYVRLRIAIKLYYHNHDDLISSQCYRNFRRFHETRIIYKKMCRQMYEYIREPLQVDQRDRCVRICHDNWDPRKNDDASRFQRSRSDMRACRIVRAHRRIIYKNELTVRHHDECQSNNTAVHTK